MSDDKPCPKPTATGDLYLLDGVRVVVVANLRHPTSWHVYGSGEEWMPGQPYAPSFDEVRARLQLFIRRDDVGGIVLAAMRLIESDGPNGQALVDLVAAALTAKENAR